MSTLKKYLALVLCLPIVGKVIKFIFPEIRFNELKILSNSKNISNTSVASIFWGFYEKAEANFINKYLFKNYDVVELGASIGAISCLIAKTIGPNNKVVSVEPGIDFTNDIEKNLKLNNLSNYQLIPKAYSSESEIVYFELSPNNNIGGKTTQEVNLAKKQLAVPSCSLSSILKSGGIKDKFILVSDIEGKEVELFLNDINSLKNCIQIIIETHTTHYKGVKYTPSNIKSMIEKLNFRLIDEYGPVYVFER